MRAFNVTVRTADTTVHYTALAHSSAEAACDAADHFGICAITVTSKESTR
jgi:hypothetical protein